MSDHSILTLPAARSVAMQVHRAPRRSNAMTAAGQPDIDPPCPKLGHLAKQRSFLDERQTPQRCQTGVLTIDIMTEDLMILGELIAEQAAHMDAAEHRLLTNIYRLDAGALKADDIL